MKYVLALLLSTNLFANSSINYDKAPLEWLITSAIQEKIDDHGHLMHNDPLVQNIFKSVDFNSDQDEIYLTSSKNTFSLKQELIDFLKTKNKGNSYDAKYEKWTNEGYAPLSVTLYKTNYKVPGHYYFNHVHTDISQDNADLKFLKISPARTFSLIETFLKNRRIKGTVAFTDHDTDRAFDLVKNLDKKYLTPLRGIEWGGKTHMCLIGLKENWDNINNGRKYIGEESIIQSRSSEAFRIVNHPNRKKVFPYTSWLDADGVEVWNTILENSPFLSLKLKRSNNRDAFKQWTDALKSGKKYTAMAGSDFHFTIPCLRDRTLAYPLNFIPETDTANTKQYLHQGRTSFVTRPTAPKLTLRAKFSDQKNWANMGDSIQGKGKVDVTLYGDFSDSNKRIGGACYNIVNRFYKLISFWKKNRWEIRFYNKQNELLAKRYINPRWYNYKKHFKATIEMPITASDLIRAELWSINRKSKSVDLLGATNPIYLKAK